VRGLSACISAAVLLTLLFPAVLLAGAESLSYRTELPASPVERHGLAWGKDPFVPGLKAGARGEAAEVKLTAVFYNRENPSAIINDRIIYRGSLVSGQKVIDIGMTHVILQGENGPIRLELAEIPELRDVNKKD